MKATSIFLVSLVCMAVAVAGESESPSPRPPADRVLIEKSARRMTLYAKGRATHTYSVALGGSPVGHKQREGDERTPEGLYSISARNSESSFHLSLRISYPNSQDRKRAAKLGVSAGGDIMIHGIRNGFGWLGPLHRLVDWTDGCVAVTNAEIEEIWQLVAIGTPVEITP